MGYVLIFNNETFNDRTISDRNSSKHDVESLKKAFYKYDFGVKIIKNPTLQDIRNNMKLLLNEKLATAFCLVVVVMTHGIEYDIAFAKDKMYNIKEEILNSEVFQKYKDLPKIVITQACKDYFDVNPITNTAAQARDIHITKMFRFDSTFEGMTAYRLNDGAPFIQLFCKHLEKYGFEMDIEKVANNVIKEFDEHRKWYGNQLPTKTITKGFGAFCLGNHVRRELSSEMFVDRDFVIS